MLDNIKAVLFDLDGTLVDSMWIWKEIDIEYLARFGLDFPSDLQRAVEGMSFSETATYFKNRFGLEDSIEQIKEDWNKMAWEKYRSEVPLKEGVLEFLQYLKSNHILTGIATSNSQDLVRLIVKSLEIEEYFDSIRTSCEVLRGKPSPDIYYLVAEDLKVKPEECLVFEDVIHGIMAGKNADMKVCAVYDDLSKDQTDEKIHLADYYIHSMKEIFA